MAIWNKLIKNDVAKGVAIGLGIAAAGLVLVPALRPAARATVKTGLVLFEKGREWIAEAGESLDDLVAEVRAELAERQVDMEAAEEVVEEAVAGIPDPEA